jgi:hypothetical protein
MSLDFVVLTLLEAEMLETFTIDTFSPHVGETFQAFYKDASLELTLQSANAYGTESAQEWSRASGRTPFSLVFTGPLDPNIQQGMYRVEHAELGAFELFLVPIGANAQAMRYEAIFT